MAFTLRDIRGILFSNRAVVREQDDGVAFQNCLTLDRGLRRATEILTANDVDTQNFTLTAAQILAGILIHTTVTAGGTITTDTAANIISGCNLNADNQVIICYYVNDGSQTATFAAGAGVTIRDVGRIVLTNGAATCFFRRASATTVDCGII